MGWWSGLINLLVFPGFLFLFACAMFFQWADRKLYARLQSRVGPPWYQPFADFVKLLAKEDVLPEAADEGICAALPLVAFAAATTAILYVPVGRAAAYAFEGDLVVVAFLLWVPTLALSLAGWLSAGPFGLVGGMRALTQLFAYEVPFLMALCGPAILAGSWSVSEISAFQNSRIWTAALQPIGLLVALTCLVGKLERVPFDIPEADTEIVAGALTEFSGRKLALFRLALDVEMVVGCALLSNLFLGGFDGPFLPVVAFLMKGMFVLFALSCIRALFARLRLDQMVRLSWGVLAPLSLMQLMAVVWMNRV